MGHCQEVGESPRLGILGKQPPPRSSARPQEPVTERGRGAHVCTQMRSRGSWHLSRPIMVTEWLWRTLCVL